jgi:hypothetical protein
MRARLRDLLQLRPLPQEGGLGLQANTHAVVLEIDAYALPLMLQQLASCAKQRDKASAASKMVCGPYAA